MSQLQRTQHAETDELLSTKLAPPRLRSPLVSREPLLARLDQGLNHKLTLLSAPAGFGKTTLISEWIHERLRPAHKGPLAQAQPEGGKVGEPASVLPPSSVSPHSFKAAWVALDAGDNDPVRFWRYVITAGQTFDVAVGQSALALLHTAQQPSFEAMLTMFINELAQLPSRGVLVLEDYHVITSRQVHEALAFLIDHLPASLHLILITRSDPPLPLARLRANGDLYELQATDLRFSSAETETFLQQALPFSLSTEAIERLEAHTEGWVAGLRLVALALQRRQEPQEIEQFLATFAGSHRYILEYLAAEVLSSQPEPLQAFLLQTTFLSRLTASPRDAVTGRTDSALMLEQLEQANLFLVPLDGAGQWYRYHAMFAEALHEYAQRHFDEAGLHDLCHKASLWYEQNGLPAEAVETALSAQEFTRAAALIERLTEPRGFTNETQTLRCWLERLPEEIRQAHPALCFAYAVVLIFTSDHHLRPPTSLLQTLLQQAEHAWRAEGNRPKLGQVLAFRAMMTARGQGDLDRAFSQAREALGLLSEGDVQWRGVSLLLVGVEEMRAGRLNAARPVLTEARALCEAAGNRYGARAATSILGGICLRQGELRQSDQLYRQVLATAGDDFSDRGPALLNLAALAYEWNDLGRAEQEVAQALDLGRQLGAEDIVVPGSLLLARLQHARAQTAQAQELLYALVAQTHQPHLLREVHAWQAWLALVAGDLTTAQRWSTAYAQPGEDLSFMRQEREALIFARMLIALGQAEAALRLLERWQTEAHAQGLTRSELEIMVLRALAHFSQSHLLQARQMLLQALTLAQPEGYQRLFLDEGEPMATLLQAILPDLNEEPLLTYTQTLLLSFAKDEGRRSDRQDENKPQILHPSGEAFSAQPLIEPLSPQEERVLRLLAAGLTNPEIARELIVSLNTVKTHVKSIYRKLDVHSRREARDAARQLNLL